MYNAGPYIIRTLIFLPQFEKKSTKNPKVKLKGINCNWKIRNEFTITRGAGEQGWRSGESARLPPMCPGFDSWTRRHMWVEFVIGSLLCSERFFSGYSGFPLSSKTNTTKFQFDLETVDEEPPRGNATANPIIIIIIIIIIITSKSFAEVQQSLIYYHN